MLFSYISHSFLFPIHTRKSDTTPRLLIGSSVKFGIAAPPTIHPLVELSLSGA